MKKLPSNSSFKELGLWVWTHHLCQIEGGKVEAVTDFIFLDSEITVDGDCSMKLKDASSLEGKL